MTKYQWLTTSTPTIPPRLLSPLNSSKIAIDERCFLNSKKTESARFISIVAELTTVYIHFVVSQ